MSTYRPTEAEDAAIDLLRLAGYAVVRQRTYDGLKERVRVAEQRTDFAEECREHTRKWAKAAFGEQRRLSDRLTVVASWATANGLDIRDLNTALDGATERQP